MARLSASEWSPPLEYFQEKLGVPFALQVVRAAGVSRKRTRGARSLWMLSADRWLATLP